MTSLTMVAGPARSKSRRPHSLAGGRHLLISLSLLLGQLAAAAAAAADEPQSKPPPPPSPPPVSPITPSAPTASISTTGNGALLAGSIQPLITATAAAAAASPGGKERAAAPIVGQINQEDPVVRLDYSTISDEILRKRTANFVYFNADFSQCRHCGRFFATWKELALDIRWWRQAVRLSTINCSDEDNVEICRRAGVTQLPQVKFYWIMSNSLEQDGQRLRILGKSVHAMRHAIMDKLLESYVDHNKLLAQRAQQRASASAVNPLAGFSTLGPGSATSNSPFTALMPIISRFLSNSKPAGAANGTSMAAAPASAATTSPLGALSASPGTRGGGGGGGKSAPGESSVSIMSLVENFGGLQGIIDALMSVASWRRSLTIQPLPSNWPELDAIEVGDTRRLLDMLPLDKARGIGALLIMETSEFLYTGLEVMLDLNPYSNKTYIARVRDERSLLTRNITGRDDLQAPALIYITETREPQLIMTAPRYTNDEDLRRAFVRAFERKQIKYAVKRVWSAAGQQLLPANSSRDDESILERVDDVHMNDLLNTIRSSLTDQVLRHSDLSDDQYNALVKYIYALISYFPFGDEQKPLKFLRRLHTWLQNQVSPLDVSEYKKQLRDMDDESLGARDWIACKSLSSVNSIASDPKRGAGALLFENPAQLGKMVSNLTRLFRSNQQKVTQLKSLLGMLTARGGGGASSTPVLLSNLPSNNGGGGGGDNSIQHEQNNIFAPSARLTTTKRPAETKKDSSGDMASSFEKLIKGVTSGSLGSDSSILKLISSALTGGSSSSGAKSGGKSKFAREFPCGAWKLAHVMAVNEYLLDSPRKDVKHIVMHSLYQYMLNFYACATCGNRVSDMAGEFRLNLNEHLIDQGDSIMLLWKLHNRVNKRLEAEIRPGSPPKQQFPSELLCAKCRTSKQQQGDLVSTPNWSQKNVFAFLLHHYRPQTIAPSDDSSSSSDSSSPPSVLLSISLVSFCKIALLFGLTQFLIRPHQ